MVLEGPLSTLDAIRFGTLVLVVALAYIAFQNRSEPGAYALIGTLVGIAVWMIGELLAGNSSGLDESVFWAKVVYSSVPIVATAIFVFIMIYVGYDEYVTSTVIGLLSIEPVLYIALIWTNQHHSYFVTDWTHAPEMYWGLKVTKGPAFVGHALYSYGIILLGTGLLVRLLRESQTLYPKQLYAGFVAILAPTISDIFYQLNITPIDLTPAAFALTGGLLTIAHFQFKLLDVSPVTQESIVENINEGLFVLDKDGEIVEINDTARTYLGLEDEHVDGESAMSVFRSDSELADLVRDVTDEKREIKHESPDGRRFFAVQVTSLRNHRDELIGRQFLLHDVTERKEKAQELQRQNDRLDRFASVVSHDLRNPLNVASGRTELALETGDVSHVESVADSLDRMETIINDVLTLARDGQTIETTEPVVLNSIAKNAWNSVDTVDATLEIDIDGDVHLKADPRRLQRLLENLVRNSIEHAGTDSTITIGQLPDGDGFYFTDDGPGIPPAKREQVLEPGYTTHADGTGLGLAIVSSIANAHGWQVSLTESTAGGVRFEFRGIDRVAADPVT